jgi:hypothetical protein
MIKKLKTLEVSLPRINDEDLELVELHRISMDAIIRAHKLIDVLPNGFQIYRNNGEGVFITGHHLGDEFVRIVEILTKKPSYLGANIPTQLDNWIQVAMVNVDKRFAESGYTKLTYELLSKRFDLVSDKEQYWAAKKLWKSLARSNTHIYVYDGSIGDYMRDRNGLPNRYNGQNIPEEVIWGKTVQHARRLLVATHTDLK